MEIESSVFCITCNGLDKGDLSISAIRVEARGSVLRGNRFRANESDGASRCRENRSLPEGCARPALALVRRRDRREPTGSARRPYAGSRFSNPPCVGRVLPPNLTGGRNRRLRRSVQSW